MADQYRILKPTRRNEKLYIERFGIKVLRYSRKCKISQYLS